MLQAWRAQKVMTWAGYILGFPTDTPESIKRDIETIKRELPVDILEFFCLTPLPGSEDHKVLSAKGVAMDPDMNNYDLEHVCTGHAVMSKEQWEGVYRDAWATYYTDDHVETILRRAAASGLKVKKVANIITAFAGGARIEGVHPLQLGVIRRKDRTQRRSGLPVESPLVFYPRRCAEQAATVARWLSLAAKYRAIMKRVAADVAVARYTDEALRVTTRQDDEQADFVQAFADVMPATHGAPARKAAATAG
jgi:hypothetical protein